MATSSQDPLAQQSALDPGEAFEEIFWNILRRRYRPDELVRIPSAMGGDYGIEGFSTDGIAYQCFADRASQTLRHRTDKQVAKLNADTLKLRKNAAELKQLLGDLVLVNYFLVVPEYHAAELIAHCTKRAEVVRAWALSFISSDFVIRVKTPFDYPDERNAALRDAGATIGVPATAISDEHVRLFTQEQPALVAVIDLKLQALSERHPGSDVAAARDHLIRAFLAKEQILKAMEDWPLTWQSIEQKRRLREHAVELESAISPDDPNRRLLSLVEQYSRDIAEDPAIRPADREQIAHGQVGDWLMRCPLHFGAYP